MEAQPEHPAAEVKRLRRCINDLVGVLALSAVWSEAELPEIASTLLEALAGVLALDLVYMRLTDPAGGAPVEMVRFARSTGQAPGPHEIGEAINHWLGPDPRRWAPRVRGRVGGDEMLIMPWRLGLLGELGVVVAGSRRADFPELTETLLLSVAANQASIGLQRAWHRAEQKRVANELDQQVAQRTKELAAANEGLKREMAERWLAEERLSQEKVELKRSEARKTAILDSALDCIIAIDHESRITEFNPTAERTFGYRRDEVVGKQLAEVIIPPSLRERHRRGFTRYLSAGESRVLGRRVEMTALRANGSEFPVELAMSRITSDGPPEFTGYLRDITERKRAEEDLRRSAAFLAEAQHLSSTGSFSWRATSDDIMWSEQMYRMFEFDRGVPVTLQLISTRVHPEDLPSLYETIGRARREGGDIEHEHRLQMPDGSIKYLHMVAHGSRDRDGRLEYIGAVQDVTHRRVSEEALGKARSELAHVSRVTSLGALTASIAHEVNQPLAGIITNASTCLRMLAADPPNLDGARETARRTIRDGHRASDVIKRLRALFAKKAVTSESVDLNEATREVITLSRSELQRNRVILRTAFADGLPPVTGDRVQLQQVILNLLLNASDAMCCVVDRPRHVVIRTEREEGDRVRLAVEDTGAGFEPQNADKLFEAFYTTKSGGMGIGLSISRSIIENHGGRLWAALNDGPGATFGFSVSRAARNAAGVPGRGDNRTPAAAGAEHAKGGVQ